LPPSAAALGEDGLPIQIGAVTYRTHI
jgi:hypothetical protein